MVAVVDPVVKKRLSEQLGTVVVGTHESKIEKIEGLGAQRGALTRSAGDAHAHI